MELQDALQKLSQLQAENAKLKRELEDEQDRVSSLQKQLAGRMQGSERTVMSQRISGIAALQAERKDKLRVVMWVSGSLRKEAAVAHARLCMGAWSRFALLSQKAKPKPIKKVVELDEDTREKHSSQADSRPPPDSGSMALMHEAHLERCRCLASWAALRQSASLSAAWALRCMGAWRQAAYARARGRMADWTGRQLWQAQRLQLGVRCCAAWRGLTHARARERLAEWAAAQLERQAAHGLLVFCFFSYRRFVKGARRPGTAVHEEGAASEEDAHRQELSLLTPAALCKAAFHQNASRRLRATCVWSAWTRATWELRQERVAVALHSRFEEEHDLMDQRILFCRDLVVKEKLRAQRLLLLRWIFDVLVKWTAGARNKARGERRDLECQSALDEMKHNMDETAARAVSTIARMRHDPKPWTMSLIVHFWALLLQISKEQMNTEAVQRRLEEAMAEVAVLRRYAAADPEAPEAPRKTRALEDFETAGRAALGIYGEGLPRPAKADLARNAWASSSSSAYVSPENAKVHLPKGNDFASTMAYLRQARSNPGSAESARPPPSIVSSDYQTAQQRSKSIGTNSALWAQLDELDGYMAGMSGRLK
ncbi:unnamed protein product [Effrenium voratum]|nr:unnamed protein product [Effrenium voratum]